MVQKTRIHSSKFLLFLLLIFSSISISAEEAIWRQLKETGDKYEKLSDEQKAQATQRLKKARATKNHKENN